MILYLSRSAPSRSRNLLNNPSNTVDSINCTSIDNESHDKQLQLLNPNEKLSTESLYSNRKNNPKSNTLAIPLEHTKPHILSTSSLQKPRVYTSDDRNLLNQQHVTLSSSSESSTSSLKDKVIKEVGETR